MRVLKFGRALRDSLKSALPPTSTTRRFASNHSKLSQLLQQIENGSISAKDAETAIGEMNDIKMKTKTPGESLESFANLDHSRSSRTGFPEAIFSAGKTPQQIVSILDDMAGHVNQLVSEESKDVDTFHKAILATR